MNGFVPGAPWADLPKDCVLLYDNASVQNALADEVLTINGVLLMHVPPYCSNFSAVEPIFADYKRAARNLAYHHPDLDDRLIHVLAFASVPVGAIQGHDHEARREMWRYPLELTGPGMPLEGDLAPVPIELQAPHGPPEVDMP